MPNRARPVAGETSLNNTWAGKQVMVNTVKVLEHGGNPWTQTTQTQALQEAFVALLGAVYIHMCIHVGS